MLALIDAATIELWQIKIKNLYGDISTQSPRQIIFVTPNTIRGKEKQK